MLPQKPTSTLRWAGKLGCLLLAAALVLPPVALARDHQDNQGRDSQRSGGRDYRHGGGKPGYHGRGRIPQVVPRMPPHHHSYTYRKKRYYSYGGVYYRPYPYGYVVVQPPHGLFVASLPIGFATLLVAGLTYYTFAGIYYRSAPGGYVVVAPPAGAVVPSPPPPPMVAPSAPLGTTVVTTTLLNMRTGPGMSYPVMATVSQGAPLTVYGRAPGWLYVRTPSGQFGWVALRFTNSPMAPVPNG
ncbi:MAG: SH3 domain-containing protein [Deltaproteobacteria bacterium]|nr:SH3 domain-containing protein [Deltaproteobacteria bacterium]